MCHCEISQGQTVCHCEISQRHSVFANAIVLLHSNPQYTSMIKKRPLLMFRLEGTWIAHLTTCREVMRDVSLRNFATTHCVSLRNFATTHINLLICKIFNCVVAKYRNDTSLGVRNLAIAYLDHLLPLHKSIHKPECLNAECCNHTTHTEFAESLQLTMCCGEISQQHVSCSSEF